MRALTISSHGGVDRLEVRDIPVPELRSAGDVRVRVRAAALNRLDLFVLEGLPGITITPDWVVGSDGAGIVDAVGADVRDVAVGDRVLIQPGISDRTCEYCRDGEQSLCVSYKILGEHVPGTCAEYVVVPAPNVRRIGREVPWEVAAALPLAALTAWRMIVTRAAVRAGDLVLIWGIGGGVALAALQVATLQGARVWVTSGSDAKLDRALALGAEAGFNHRTQDVAREVRARTGKRGADVVVDTVGQATWSRSLLALGKRGRLVTCGATSGPIVETDVRRLFWNQWSILGSTMGNDHELDAMLHAFERGRLSPVIDSTYALEDGRAAYERLASPEHFGKIVLRLGDGD